YIWKVIGIITKPELRKPKLLIRGRRYGSFNCTFPGLTSPRLVKQVNGEISSQKNILEAFPSIRCCFPCFFGLPGPMQENQWKVVGHFGNLIERIGMITMKGLSLWPQSAVQIKSARFDALCATDHKTALPFNDHIVVVIFHSSVAG